MKNENEIVGATVTRRIVVDPPRTIDFMGDDCRVYATPELIRDIEVTCRDLLLQHLDAGEDSLGTRVELDHIAPTMLGMWSDITATIVGVDRRAVSFEVSVVDALEQTAKGKHDRFVADVAKTAHRMRAKAEKAG